MFAQHHIDIKIGAKLASTTPWMKIYWHKMRINFDISKKSSNFVPAKQKVTNCTF
jgi:hypothetical protein